jgi:DNA repair exonuclease SbcCD ATPase subunit
MNKQGSMSQTLAARLLKQLELYSQREDELLAQNRALARNAAQRQLTSDKVAAAKEAKEKLETLKEKALKSNEAARNAWIAQAEEDDRLRKELSEQLSVEISEVNSKVQQGSGDRAAALEENARLKEQLKILRENLGSGDDKFTQLVEAREKETANLQARLASELENRTTLEKKIKEQEELLGPAREAYKVVKEEVDAFVAKFTAIQQSLQAANAEYTKTRQDQERTLKRIAQQEKELEEHQKRSERAKKDCEAEIMAAAKLEAQLGLLESQTTKLQQLTQVLRTGVEKGKGTHVDPSPTATTATPTPAQ